MVSSMKTSGHNIHLQLVGETYDKTRVGTLEVTGNQVPLVDESIPSFQVMVQNSHNNQAYLLVGNNYDGCYFEVAPGQAITILINNLDKVFLSAVAGTITVNYIATV